MLGKKGQGLPITVIIIAAIALVILVVLVAMFIGKMGIFGKKVTTVTEISCTESCFLNAQGARVHGEVFSETCPTDKPYHEQLGSFRDVGPGEVCCVDDSKIENDPGC
ncbi:hypothetical protein DRJ16_00460 [Candidatus Woesearchaeota archaeon]|nr:MAG: hypothetical protein DRJ16_00460 [Candidatus Woesearchaeota archaeon]